MGTLTVQLANLSRSDCSLSSWWTKFLTRLRARSKLLIVRCNYFESTDEVNRKGHGKRHAIETDQRRSSSFDTTARVSVVLLKITQRLWSWRKSVFGFAEKL
jgi:hypothetical protein